jgi:ABC-2 type transport system ATP-binding protein
VALDSTQALIRRISGSQLVVELASGSLPEKLKPLVSHPEELAGGAKFTLRVNEYPEVEEILRVIREGGATIADMNLKQADLEDVFLQIMEGDK